MAAEPDATGGPLNDLTAFQRDMLAVVGQLDKPHGLAVKEQMEIAYEISDVQHGRLYPNLDSLADLGLIEKGEKDKRTNYYTMTRRGRRELASHLDWMGTSVDTSMKGCSGP